MKNEKIKGITLLSIGIILTIIGFSTKDPMGIVGNIFGGFLIGWSLVSLLE